MLLLRSLLFYKLMLTFFCHLQKSFVMEDHWEELIDESSSESTDSEADEIEHVASSGLHLSREEADRCFSIVMACSCS